LAIAQGLKKKSTLNHVKSGMGWGWVSGVMYQILKNALAIKIGFVFLGLFEAEIGASCCICIISLIIAIGFVL
jgi:hypothetical protein